MERGEPQGSLDNLCREAVGGSLGGALVVDISHIWRGGIYR